MLIRSTLILRALVPHTRLAASRRPTAASQLAAAALSVPGLSRSSSVLAYSPSLRHGMSPSAAVTAAAAAEDGPPPAKRARGRQPRKPAGAGASAGSPPAAALDAAAPLAAPTPPSAGKKKNSRAARTPSELVLGSQAALTFKAQRIAELLGRLYPNPPIPLDHASTFQLLCAVLLSAQVGRQAGVGRSTRCTAEQAHLCLGRSWYCLLPGQTLLPLSPLLPYPPPPADHGQEGE